jgi:hypothetical protein
MKQYLKWLFTSGSETRLIERLSSVVKQVYPRDVVVSRDISCFIVMHEWATIATTYFPKVVWMIIAEYYYHSNPNIFDHHSMTWEPNPLPVDIQSNGRKITFPGTYCVAELGYAICHYPLPLRASSFTVLFDTDRWVIGIVRPSGESFGFHFLGIFNPYHQKDIHDAYAFRYLTTTRTNIPCRVTMKINLLHETWSFVVDGHDFGIAPKSTLALKNYNEWYPFVRIGKGSATIVNA